MPSTLHRAAALLAVLALARAGTARAEEPPAPSAPRIAETIEVREVEVRFDESVLPPLESLGKHGRGDFAVIEDGLPREVLQLARDEEHDWSLVLWFDPRLAGLAARAAAARALAERAADLAARGTVELVVVDPRPTSRLATGSAAALRAALLAIARDAEAALDPLARPAAPTRDERLRALDRLQVELAARPAAGPRALLLPVEGWELGASELDEIGRLANGAADVAGPLRPLDDASRALAAAGWVTFALALAAEAAPDAIHPGSQGDVRTGGFGDRQVSFPVFTFPTKRRRPSGVEQRQLDAVTDLGLAAVAQLARPTSGGLLGHAEILGRALERLFGRSRLVYRAPVPAAPGSARALEVRWTGGDGRALPSPRWLASGTPREVAAARLRLAIAGEAPPVREGWSLAPVEAAPAGRWRLCLPAARAGDWVRVSFASGEPTARLETGQPRPTATTEGGVCLEVDPPWTDALPGAAVGEDLDTGDWLAVTSRRP